MQGLVGPGLVDQDGQPVSVRRVRSALLRLKSFIVEGGVAQGADQGVVPQDRPDSAPCRLVLSGPADSDGRQGVRLFGNDASMKYPVC